MILHENWREVQATFKFTTADVNKILWIPPDQSFWYLASLLWHPHWSSIANTTE